MAAEYNRLAESAKQFLQLWEHAVLVVAQEWATEMDARLSNGKFAQTLKDLKFAYEWCKDEVCALRLIKLLFKLTSYMIHSIKKPWKPARMCSMIRNSP